MNGTIIVPALASVTTGMNHTFPSWYVSLWPVISYAPISLESYGLVNFLVLEQTFLCDLEQKCIFVNKFVHSSFLSFTQ